MDGLGSIVISMAAIFAIALVLVIGVAIRTQRRREGTARTRVKRRLAQHRADASGQPDLFTQALSADSRALSRHSGDN